MKRFTIILILLSTLGLGTAAASAYNSLQFHTCKPTTSFITRLVATTNAPHTGAAYVTCKTARGLESYTLTHETVRPFWFDGSKWTGSQSSNDMDATYTSGRLPHAKVIYMEYKHPGQI